MRLTALRHLLAGHRRGLLRDQPDWTPAPVSSAAAPDPATPPDWSALRLQVVETLWGQGFVLPGGAEEVLRLAAPLGLSAASSLLIVGVGSGGALLRLAGDLGVWVRGFEAEPFLAETASRRVQRAGAALAKRATVERWTRAAPDFPRHAFHHALALDALRTARPQDVLAAVAMALRAGGQIALLQTVAGTPFDPRDPAAAAWRRLDGLPLPDGDVIGRALTRLGFEVRVAEDVSARHVRHAVAGWHAMLRGLHGVRPDPVTAAAMVTEAERWLRRIQMMRAGHVRMMRWLALDRRGET
jgi:hypothetical protein